MNKRARLGATNRKRKWQDSHEDKNNTKKFQPTWMEKWVRLSNRVTEKTSETLAFLAKRGEMKQEVCFFWENSAEAPPSCNAN